MADSHRCRGGVEAFRTVDWFSTLFPHYRKLPLCLRRHKMWCDWYRCSNDQIVFVCLFVFYLKILILHTSPVPLPPLLLYFHFHCIPPSIHFLEEVKLPLESQESLTYQVWGRTKPLLPVSMLSKVWFQNASSMIWLLTLKSFTILIHTFPHRLFSILSE